MKLLTTIWHDERRLAPARAVMHPAWILAVFVLLVNDHVLKPLAFAEPLTGKLSDFAGLFLFPVLAAVLFGVRTRRGLVVVGAATAAVFATLNLSTSFAATFDAVVSTVFPFSTTVDPSDLVALVAIPFGLWFFEPLMRSTHAGRSRRAIEAAAVTVGALSCMATSPRPCDTCFEDNQSAQVSILNLTNELHILRVRSLRAGMQFDCDLVATDPSTYLVDAAFGPPQSWFIQSGQEIPVPTFATSGGACQAALVESDTAPDILVFWDANEPVKSFPFDADIPREIPPDDNTVVLDADYSRAAEAEMHEWRERSDCGERADLCADDVLAPLATIPTGARYFWRSQADGDLHHVRSTAVEGTLDDRPDECRSPGPSAGVVWEPPPTGEGFVVAVDEGRDGCHELTLAASPEDPEGRGWWICAPFEALETLVPAPSEQKRIAIVPRTEPATFTLGGYQSIEIDVTTLPDGGPQRLDTIHVFRGYGAPSAADFQPEFVPIEGCEPIEVECGQIAVPVEVDATAYGVTIRPGESASAGEVQPVDIFVVRAEGRPVVDTTCDVDALGLVPGGPPDSLGYIEAVVVRRSAGR